ncbi:insulin-like peptide receptor isoform X2 [Saccostrea echinata]|uniref:insulin-like peptide receptor isoform X2 n=1 Tax=Saccostrea echinata TaxID=191078 RepID=UPI002A82921D|nr:insulin-like peptide receptor isoform X2 [Saccostrea echinata]
MVKLLQQTACFLLLVILCQCMVGARYAMDKKTTKYPNPNGKGMICEDVDIRNDVNAFAELENCTVIEGNLKILLIEGASHQQYENLYFPDLVEITEFFLLYRVYGLKSLRRIFPNLSIIRGHKLFFNFALVVFELMDLEELGLIGLTTIERGAVRFEKNPMLCYIDTIDWTKIAVGVQGMSEHYFKRNRIAKECVDVCPSNCTSTAVVTASGEVTKEVKNRCWTKSHCQKILSCDRGDCLSGICDKGICCHPNCLGGCTGPTDYDCKVCKNVVSMINGKTICQKQCLPGTYTLRKRRCLLEHECTDVIKYKLVQSEQREHPGECVDKCLAGYLESKDGMTCVKCVDKCPKSCNGKKLETVAQSQELFGCTKIVNHLEIRIRKGSNVAQELEKNLGQIEEVQGYVWIHNSNILLSLGFFKNLRMIRGQSSNAANSFALLVHDNMNLQELFPENVMNNLEIENGKMIFHYNRKLCYNKIKTFEEKVKMPNKSQNDISDSTNGDQMPCTVETLNLTVVKIAARIAFLRWDNFKTSDARQLLSYVINWKEAPFKNLSIYEGRDVCDDDVWNTKDILNKMGRDEDHVTSLLLNLKPWTQYAVYVQTYTTSSAKFGAISKIVYFTTLPYYPTIPDKLRVKALAPGTLKIMWNPPSNPHGNVTHYEVYWRKRPLVHEKFNERDYCSEPLDTLIEQSEDLYDEQDELDTGRDQLGREISNKTLQGECACPKSNEEEEVERKEREMQIAFENFLHNYVYLKRTDYGPPKPMPDLPTDLPTSMDSKKAERLFKKNRKFKNFNITRPTRLPKNQNPKFARQRAKRYSREASMQYNSSVPGHLKFNLNDSLENDTDEANETEKDLPFNKVIVQTPVQKNDMSYIISNLGHFQDYRIEVIACQERDPRDPARIKLCSIRAISLARTLPDKKADNIDVNSIKIYKMTNNTGEVIVNWDEPKKPNGLILSYDIQYSKVIKDVKPNTLCVPHLKYKKIHGYKLQKLEPGNYSVQIRATSLAFTTNYTEPKYFFVSAPATESEWPPETIIAVTVSGVLLLILIVVIGVWLIARSRFKKIPDRPDFTSINPDYEHYNPDEWEVERDKIQLIRELGQGSFGMVYEGVARDLYGKGGEIKVAVKTVNEHATYRERMEFLSEASRMKAFACNHVVRLLGVVSDGQPALLIMELMEKGDLKNFLRMHRPVEEDIDSTFAGIKENISRTPPTIKRIIQMAGEIADGMAYLADKKFVHRDLAARNCMVAEDLTVKIADFGMTRDIYETDYYRKGGKALLPVRWMAPESLKDGIFTSLSDVWSYGVVLWEMATLAAQPYQGLSNEEVLRYVLNGRVMEKPEDCPDRLFELMQKCWRYRPKQRPTFKEILEELVPELDPSFAHKSYFFSDENKQDSLEYIEEGDEDVDESKTPFIQDEDECDMKGAEGGVDLHELQDQELDDDIDIGVDYYPPDYQEAQHSNQNGELFPELRIDKVNNVLYSRSQADKLMLNGTEPCDCILTQENNPDLLPDHQFSSCSNPYSAIGSSDDSKDSSKSSSSSYAQMNGVHIANGHIAMHHLKTTKC